MVVQQYSVVTTAWNNTTKNYLLTLYRTCAIIITVREGQQRTRRNGIAKTKTEIQRKPLTKEQKCDTIEVERNRKLNHKKESIEEVFIMKKNIDKYTVEVYAEIKGETRFVSLLNGYGLKECKEDGLHYFALFDGGEFGGDLITTCDVLHNDNEFYEVVEPHTIESEYFNITYHTYRWVNRISK